ITHPPTTELYTLSLHDALPICVHEYFLSQFASAEGKKGGQFYTPSRVVRVLVEMLAPYKGRVYDPCCGSGGMFVSSEKFIEAHRDRKSTRLNSSHVSISYAVFC